MRWASPPDSVPEGAVEAEVVEPHLGQEAEPSRELGDHLRGHGSGLALEDEAFEEGARLAHGKGADLLDVAAAHAHAQRLRPQAAPPAGVTLLVAAVPAQEDADLDLVLLGLEPAEEAEDALELLVALEHRSAAGPSSRSDQGRSRGIPRRRAKRLSSARRPL